MSCNDPRYVFLRRGLEQLSSLQLQHILNYQKEIVYDNFNYDEATGRYWPIAVGLGVPETNTDNLMTNEKCKFLIMSHGVDTNPLKGIEGAYYTNQREKDLKDLIRLILEERKHEN